MKYFLCVQLLFTALIVNSQSFTIEEDIPLEVNDLILANPWAGGLNAGQYNTMDIDFDGDEDLVVFDRTSRKISVFLYSDGKHIYAPEWAVIFPEGLTNWMLLRDFNCDGLKDIFTSDPLGMKVFVNSYDGEQYRWRIFNSKDPQPSPLLTKGFSDTPINIQMNGSDIPAIDDIDDDGDLDILVFRFSSQSTVELHRNLSIERSSSCDSMQFERITQRWGDFEECNCNSFALNGDDCPGIGGGRTEHQSGKSILTLDFNGDGARDVVVGEEDCPVLSVLTNSSTSLDAEMFEVSSAFPNANQSVVLSIFPAAYLEDVDNDGVKDLLVAPNVPSNATYGVNYQNSSWLYRNTGSNQQPNFEFAQTNFLQDEMFDLGENAAPSFFDYDADGDLDMFVGSFISNLNGFESTIKLYKNEGTRSMPSFVLENDDLFSFSQVGFINIKPELTDFNNDGFIDIVFMATLRSTLATALYVLKGEQGNFQFNNQIEVLFAPNAPIRVDENMKLFDVDGDGLKDLLYGRSTGRLEYHKNTGTLDAPVYTLEDQTFYGLDFSPFRQNILPDFGDLDGDGNIDMITGDARGNLTLYTNIFNTLDNPDEGEIELIELDEEFVAYNFGSKIRPVIVNLFDESKPALALGTGQGGITFLRSGSAVSNPSEGILGIYPNPVRFGEQLTIRSLETTRASIVSLLGQVIVENILLEANEEVKIDVSFLKEGLYLLVPESGEATRFVLSR